MDESRNYGHIFRLEECEIVIVISDELKNALEKDHVTGFRYYEPGEFVL